MASSAEGAKVIRLKTGIRLETLVGSDENCCSSHLSLAQAMHDTINGYCSYLLYSVPLATEPCISLIILTPMKILQRNLNISTFVVWEMKRDVSVVRFKCRCNILISGKIIKEMPGSVASGTRCISTVNTQHIQRPDVLVQLGLSGDMFRPLNDHPQANKE
jgi:hypothetical protein